MRIILAVSVHDFSSDWVDYVVHFGIDVLGTLATLYAQRFCKHRISPGAYLVRSVRAGDRYDGQPRRLGT